VTTQLEKGEAFRSLHAGEPFVIPNPWDAGSARVLEGLGFRVYACTSTGPVEIRGLGDVATIKTDTVHGFNFLAFPPRSAVGPAVLAATA